MVFKLDDSTQLILFIDHHMIISIYPPSLLSCTSLVVTIWLTIWLEAGIEEMRSDGGGRLRRKYFHDEIKIKE